MVHWLRPLDLYSFSQLNIRLEQLLGSFKKRYPQMHFLAMIVEICTLVTGLPNVELFCTFSSNCYMVFLFHMCTLWWIYQVSTISRYRVDPFLSSIYPLYFLETSRDPTAALMAPPIFLFPYHMHTTEFNAMSQHEPVCLWLLPMFQGYNMHKRWFKETNYNNAPAERVRNVLQKWS